MKKSFLKSTDFSASDAAEILELARVLKRDRGDPQHRVLDGQTWALLFHKSSTRTRISFEVGLHELGAHPMILDANSMQMGRGETIEDTAKVMSRYIHGLIIRTFDHQLAENFVSEGNLHVVNALTDYLHPCQIYADIFTLAEQWAKPGEPLADSVKGKTLSFYGDCASNMAHSWILGGALFGMNVRLSGPKGFAPDPAIDKELADAGLEKNYEFSEDPMAIAEGADAVYTDVWVSMGDEEERETRLQVMKPYQVNKALMDRASDKAFFLHCLPAHEGEEVSSEIYHSSQSIVFDEAENRLHAQKAIMTFLAR